jgi:hypothetical protein
VAGYTACPLCGAGGTDAEAAALDAALVEVCGGATFSVWLRASHALVIWTAVRLSQAHRTERSPIEFFGREKTAS